MSETRAAESPSRWAIPLLSLLPWAAFMVPFSLAVLIGGVESAPGELGGAALFCLAAVALPALVALLAAQPGAMRIAVLVVLVVLAGAVGIIVATSSDAQASLAVIWFPVFALPLAFILGVGRFFGRGATRSANSDE